jgi:hypothetical protein
VSPTGLDGFPPEPREFTVEGDLLDLVPPVADIRVHGSHVMLGGLLVLGAATTLEGVVEDDTGLEGEWVPILNGEEVDLEEWAGGWPEGEHELSGYAVDGAGLFSEPLGPIEMLSDPVPPEIHWSVGDRELMERHGVDQHWDHQRERRLRRKAHSNVVAEWSPDGRRWNPIRALSPEEANREDGKPIAQWQVKSDHPQIFFRVMRNQAFAADAPLSLSRGEFLRIWADDALSAVRELLVSVHYYPGDRHYLEVRAWDVAGNLSVEKWPLAPRRDK